MGAPQTPQHAFYQCITAVVANPHLFARFYAAFFHCPLTSTQARSQKSAMGGGAVLGI